MQIVGMIFSQQFNHVTKCCVPFTEHVC